MFPQAIHDPGGVPLQAANASPVSLLSETLDILRPSFTANDAVETGLWRVEDRLVLVRGLHPGVWTHYP
jgi:hypothetical protein